MSLIDLSRSELVVVNEVLEVDSHILGRLLGRRSHNPLPNKFSGPSLYSSVLG